MKSRDKQSSSANEEGCDTLLNNLTNSDQVTPTMQSIIMKRWDSNLENSLKRFLSMKEDTIKEVCHSHYKDFGQSVNEILTMKRASTDIKRKLITLNENLAMSAKDLYTRIHQLEEIKVVQSNVNTGRNMLSLCQDIVKAAKKADSQLKQQQYFVCLRTLESITSLLDKIPGSLFKNKMNNFVAITKSRIKEDVMNSFALWNDAVQDNSRTRGEYYYRELLGQTDAEAGPAPAELDYSPVHGAMSIFDCLQCGFEFVQRYKAARKKYCDIQFISDKSLSDSTSEEFMKQYKSVLFRVIDFFKTEFYLASHHKGFFQDKELKDMWTVFWKSFDIPLKKNIRELSDPRVLFELKSFLSDFRRVLSGPPFSFATTIIDKSFNDCVNIFNRSLVSDAEAETKTIYPEKMFQFYSIENMDEYNRIIVKYGLEDARILGDDGIPIFPLSTYLALSVALSCKLVEKTINEIGKYLGGYNTDEPPNPEVLESIEKILLTFSNAINEFMKNNTNQSVSQFAQTYLNATFMAKFCARLDDVSKIGFDFSMVNATKTELTVLQFFEKSRTRFNQTADKARDGIFDLINRRLSDFLEDSNTWGWNGEVINMMCHEEIRDVVDYLETIPSQIECLPPGDRDGIFFSTCCRLNTFLLEMLTGEKTKKLNMVGIFNWNMDILELESYTENTGVADLRQCFSQTRNLCDALMSGAIEKEIAKRRSGDKVIDTTNMKVILSKYKDVSNQDRLYGEDAMISLPRLTKKECDAALRFINSL